MDKYKKYLRLLKVCFSIKGRVSRYMAYCGLFFAILPIISAKVLQYLTDELRLFGFGKGNSFRVVWLLTVLAGANLLKIIERVLNVYCNESDEINLAEYVKETLLKLKCDVRYKYFENQEGFQKRIAFVEEFLGGTLTKSLGKFFSILQYLASFVLCSVVLWEVSPLIVFALYITSIPAATLSYLQQDETFRNRVKWIEEGALAIYLFNTIAGASYVFNGQQEIRHWGLFAYLKNLWRRTIDDYVKKKNVIIAKHLRYNIVADFFNSVVYMVVLLLAGKQVFDNPGRGLGTFTLVFSLTSQLQSITANMFGCIMGAVESLPYMNQLFALDELEKEVASETHSGVTRGRIVFDNVSFAYSNTETLALKDISLEIKEGEKVAIVGENGSGKTTFINLVCGMFEPQSGKVQIDSKCPLDMRHEISVVFQDFAHYESTLRENITVSDMKRDSSDDDIYAILDSIGASSIVDYQNGGLDEEIGSFSEKFNNLSGGEWQKVALARALYRNKASVLILDEPTSALDPIAEAELYRSFSNMTGDKTTLLISHRLGVTSLVNRILVFKDGQVVEDGSHKELMAKNGEYARLYTAQAQLYH